MDTTTSKRLLCWIDVFLKFGRAELVQRRDQAVRARGLNRADRLLLAQEDQATLDTLESLGGKLAHGLQEHGVDPTTLREFLARLDGVSDRSEAATYWPVLKAWLQGVATELGSSRPKTRREGDQHAPQKRKRRLRPSKGLTDNQAKILVLFAERNGNKASIAKELGISRSVVSRQLSAAWRKLPELAPKKGRSVGKVQALPLDRRGQPTV